MTYVYTVHRNSADGTEVDVFAGTPEGWDMASRWAKRHNVRVQEEPVLDSALLSTMEDECDAWEA